MIDTPSTPPLPPPPGEPTGQHGGAAGPVATPVPGNPAPLYRRSFFWVLMGMLAGALILALMLRACPQTLPPGVQNAPAPGQTEAGPGPDAGAGTGNAEHHPGANEERDAALRDLLELQKAQNKGLEEELRRLQILLKEDPCAVSGELGARPEKAPLAPEYAPSRGENSAPESRQNAQPAPFTEPVPERTKEPDAGRIAAPATVAELLEQATVFVISSYDDALGVGSGFFVAPGVIATNRHVVQDASAEVIIGNKVLGGMHEAHVLAFSSDENRDYALLRIAPSAAAKAPFLRIGDGAGRTERVSSWGFPGFITEIDPKLEALVRDGDARSVPEVVYSEGVVSVVLDRTPPVILHTAALSQGNSGGPLVNAQGVVVGINSFIKKADQSYMQTSIALPGSDLAAFMQEYGVRAAPAEGGP